LIQWNSFSKEESKSYVRKGVSLAFIAEGYF
jgi:hypothetical protein